MIDDPAAHGLELLLEARAATLPGGLQVHRAIPQARRRMVGPFVFLDEMGPADLQPDAPARVLTHPHIGLSTLTYLFEGEGLHKDSLGSVQRILPGEVNWMTAGRGITHAELLGPGQGSSRVHGLQLWVALPGAREEQAPTFSHFDASATRLFEEGGVSGRLVSGTLWGERAAVEVSSPLFLVDAWLEAGAVLQLPATHPERAAYVVSGGVELGAARIREKEIGFFPAGGEVLLCATERTHLVLLGGEPLEGPRHIRWNFVSSSKDRLAQAVEDWRHQRFPRVPGETRFIPLPEDGDAPVDYP